MSFVVTENCIRCKYMDCVAVCPADCFHEGEAMLVIDPAACIDCGICVPECPARAIRADTEEGAAGWARMNAKYAAVWPSIASKKAAPADAADWDGVPGKLHAAFQATDPAGA